MARATRIGHGSNAYVYRLSAAWFDVTCPVSLDGRKLGELAVGTFAHEVVNPGPHTVIASCGRLEASSSFAAAAGENVFVKLEPRQHWAWPFTWSWGEETWRLLLQPMAEPDEAMAETRRCDLIAGT